MDAGAPFCLWARRIHGECPLDPHALILSVAHVRDDVVQAPLIAEPFLTQEEGSDVIRPVTDGSLEVEWAYNIVGFLAFPLFLTFMAWGYHPVKGWSSLSFALANLHRSSLLQCRPVMSMLCRSSHIDRRHAVYLIFALILPLIISELL